MKHLLQSLITWLAAGVLRLRYRIRVEGLEEVRGLHGALIVPQHPAYVDPVIVLRTVYAALRPRPMLFADIFRNPLLFWLPWALDALEIPNLEQHSAHARAQAERSIQGVIEGLRRGENFILWPAGRVQRQPYESLGAARSLAQIAHAVPQAPIIAVRDRGLWGSSFGFAYQGKAPNLVVNLLQCAGLILANLIFFMPKRTVTITLERMDMDKLWGGTTPPSPALPPEGRGTERPHPSPLPPPQAPEGEGIGATAHGGVSDQQRQALNAALEAWYNAPGPEQATFVPYHFWFGPRERKFPLLPQAEQVDVAQVKPEVRSAVMEMLAEALGRDLDQDEVAPETKLDRLGLDSLDAMEVALAIEQRFGFRSDAVAATVGDLWALAAGQLSATGAEPPGPPPGWFAPPPSDLELKPLADTIPVALVRKAVRHRSMVIVADDLAGAITYERFLVGALLLAEPIKQSQAANVGLLMPASVAADIALLGLYLAGKTPIVLNWTTGPGNLAHAVQLTGVTHVVTSRKFADRIGLGDLPGVTFLYLEDMRAGIGKFAKLAALLRVQFLPRSIELAMPKPKPDEPAVVLFTSGSEKAPKAVPLSHRNILSCLAGGLEGFALTPKDVLVGFLPVFHSFGLSVTTLLPLLAGMRLVHHPDPTDARGLVKKIAAYKPTLLCGTPTFVGYILNRAKGDDLASLRLIVVGAEKCPEALFAQAQSAAPEATLLEGFGITECAPLVAANTPVQHKRGSIGKPLPGVSVRVVNGDTMQPVAPGERGMMLVAGDNVFGGYLGKDVPVPFHEMEGRRWYVTGDLVTQDAEGFLHFAGRLKRFVKVGGEMVSLPALEEAVAAQYPPTPDGPQVAVEAIEPGAATDNGPAASGRIVLFTTADLPLRQANTLLLDKGLRGVMRFDEVRQVERIPVLGTGKTDYKQLKQWIGSNGK